MIIQGLQEQGTSDRADKILTPSLAISLSPLGSSAVGSPG
jgi:hypothetical protein